MAIVETLEVRDKNVIATLSRISSSIDSVDKSLKGAKASQSSFVASFSSLATGANQFLELGKKGANWIKWTAELIGKFAEARKELEQFRDIEGFGKINDNFDRIETTVKSMRITAVKAGEAIVEVYGKDVADALDDALSVSLGLLDSFVRTGQGGVSAFAALDGAIKGFIANFANGVSAAINFSGTLTSGFLLMVAKASRELGGPLSGRAAELEATAQKILVDAANKAAEPGRLLGQKIADAINNGIGSPFQDMAKGLDEMAKDMGKPIDAVGSRVKALGKELRDFSAATQILDAQWRNMANMPDIATDGSLVTADIKANSTKSSIIGQDISLFAQELSAALNGNTRAVEDNTNKREKAEATANTASGIMGAISSGSVAQIGALAGPIGAAIGTGIELAADPEALTEALSGLGDTIGNALVSILSGQLVLAIAEGIWNAFARIWESIKQFFTGLFDVNLVNNKANAWDYLAEIGTLGGANTDLGGGWNTDALPAYAQGSTSRSRGIQGRRRNQRGNAVIHMNSAVTDPTAVDRLFRELNRNVGTRGRGWEFSNG